MATPKTVDLMIDGVKTPCLVRVDGNGEFACYSKPDDLNPKGRVFFFPEGCDLREKVKKHNQANSEVPVFAADLPSTVDTELDEWLGSTPPADQDEEKETQTIHAGEVGSVEDVLETE